MASTEPAPKRQAASDSRWLNVVAGGSLGLLVGLLVGMSVSPIVGAVMGFLATIAIAFMSFSAKAPSDGAVSPVAAVPVNASSVDAGPVLDAVRSDIALYRLAAFAILCIVGIGGGVWIRTHDRLSPTLVERSEAWQKLGFTKGESRKLVAFAETGYVPGEVPVPKGDASVTKGDASVPKAATGPANGRFGSILVGADAKTCDELRADLGKDPPWSVRGSFDARGGDLAVAAKAAGWLPESSQKEFLGKALAYLCKH